MTAAKTAAQKASTAQAAVDKPEPPAAAVAADAHWAAKRERLKARRNPELPLRICDDDDLKTALAEAERKQRLATATLEEVSSRKESQDQVEFATARLADADAAVAAADEAVNEASVILKFRALPSPEYEALVKEHPPTEAQAEAGAPWNADTFSAALISAASLDGMPVEDAQDYLDTWGPAEALTLFESVNALHHKVRMDLGKG